MLANGSCFFIVLSNYKEREEEHNDKEREVKCGEDEEVFSCLALIVLWVFSKGYKTCEWRYDSSAASDVYTEQKLSVIIREAREKDRRGNVAYKLAGECADNESAFVEKEDENLPYRVDSWHISRENKEENESKEKSVVNVKKSVSIHE